MDATAARALLVSMIQSSVDPTLTADEIDSVVLFAKRADPAGNPTTNVVAGAAVWQSGHAYVVGDVIYEAGRFWRATYAGTSGTTEPTWPDLTQWPLTDATVWDNDLIWADNGGEWAGTWHLDAGAAFGWRLKAGKVQPRFDFAADGQRFDRSQQFAHCMDMAKTYERRVNGAAQVSSG